MVGPWAVLALMRCNTTSSPPTLFKRGGACCNLAEFRVPRVFTAVLTNESDQRRAPARAQTAAGAAAGVVLWAHFSPSAHRRAPRWRGACGRHRGRKRGDSLPGRGIRSSVCAPVEAPRPAPPTPSHLPARAVSQHRARRRGALSRDSGQGRPSQQLPPVPLFLFFAARSPILAARTYHRAIRALPHDLVYGVALHLAIVGEEVARAELGHATCPHAQGAGAAQLAGAPSARRRRRRGQRCAHRPGTKSLRVPPAPWCWRGTRPVALGSDMSDACQLRTRVHHKLPREDQV